MLRFFIVFLFSAFTLFAQDNDTLLTHLLRIENDTECVNQLYRNGLDLADKDPKLAYAMAQYSERIANGGHSQKHISFANNLLGVLLTKQGLYKKALPYIEKYVEINKALKNNLGLAIGCRNLGNIYLRLKQFQKAEIYFLEALNYYNSLNNKAEVANELINLGVLKHQLGQIDAALQNYEKALQAGKELNDYEIKAICLNNLAQIYSDKGNYEKALAYNFDALELRELMGLDIDVADSYLSIAEVALKQKEVVLAEENLNAALALCKQLDYFEGKITYHKLLSELFSQKNDYRSAYENLKLYETLNDSFLQLHINEPENEFSPTEEKNYNYTKPPLKNLWLLVLLSIILIIVPFTLMRYKR
jgi:tetratricopeptide (TPR) repeat protein